jgi:transglutaminase-like putative cysteine protease
MARTQGTSARTQRLIAGVATVLVAAAAAIALGRVFEGNGPTMRLLAAGVASAVIASLLERRNLVLATLASIVGLSIAIGWLVFPETTWFGLPTPDTLRAALDAAALVGEQARVQVAPSPPLAPLMLAGLAGVWAAVFAAHSLAFRAGSPLLGLLPPVALVGFADSVLEDVIRPIFGLLFLIAATALLFADGLRRVQGWGPVWTGPGRAARLDVAAGRGARRVAAAAVMVAAMAPIVLPGFGSRGVIDFSTSDDDRVRIDPLVSVQESLQRDEIIPVFDVQTDVGRYWRMVALPNFDGRVWSPDPEPTTLAIEPGATLAPSDTVASPGATTEVTFTTASELALPWLPLPYPPRSTDAPIEGMRWDPESGSVVLESGVEPGLTYTAVADVVQPTPDQLRDEPIVATAETVRYTLTPDLPEIAGLASEWTRGQATTYDQIIAIQDRFTDPKWGFTYDATVPGSSSDQAMLEFLTQTKKGFCQQFSSAMAVMLRTLGIPARLAVGFTPGEPAGSGDRLTVTTENAHSWVEVLFPSYGWVPFEPTPNRQNVVAYPYLDPDTAERCVSPDGSPCSPTGPNGGTRGTTGTENAGTSAFLREQVRPDLLPRDIRGAGESVVGGVASAPGDPGPFTQRNALLAAALAVFVTLAVIPLARSWRRRRRLRRAGSSPRDLILATYDVFTDRAAELGHPRVPGQTLDEYRRAVAGTSGSQLGDLDALTRLTTGAAYGGREPDAADAEAAGRASGSVVRAMRRDASWTQRLTGPYRRR